MKRSRHLIFLIFLFLFAAWGSSIAEQAYEEVMIGDHIYLGTLEQDGNTENGKEPISWTVIDLDDNYCILITDRIIGHKAFDTSAGSNTNWANSTLRSWMNKNLFQDIFSESEQEMIVPVKTDESGKNINNYETMDKIFLLSKEQAEYYSLRNEARVIPSEQTDFTLEKDAYHREEWWLRTSYGATKKQKQARGVASGKLESSLKMEQELGIRPVVMVQKAYIKVGPFKLPERDEYHYLMSRAIQKTAPMKCMNNLINKTIEYLSQHYDKAFRIKYRRSNHYIYYIINTTTGETLTYDDKPNHFTPSSYTITVEKNIDRFSKNNSYEKIDMSTAAHGFFD